MTAIRKPGKVTENVTLIDFKYEGVAGVGGIYLIEAGKKCLIDSGSKDGAPHVIKTLKELNAFPPDYVIITHSHWDHSQGVPLLRKKAKQEQKSIEVFASEKAIPLLEDQSYNEVFKQKRFDNIKDTFPLKEGDIIDLEMNPATDPYIAVQYDIILSALSGFRLHIDGFGIVHGPP